MSLRKLHSCLAGQLQHFIELRRLAGTDYHSQAQLLGYFDRFLDEEGVREPQITREITDAYQQSLGHLARGPGQPLRRGPTVLRIPLADRSAVLCANANRPQTPHATSTASPRSMLLAADLRPHTYRTLLGLLYSTGLRIGEAFALKLEDFHEDQQCLYIAQGKFRKARWVFLSNSAGDALHQYTQRRQQIGPATPDSPLFVNLRSRRLCHPTVYHTFRHLLSQCGIRHSADTGPRIHDLRHNAASRIMPTQAAESQIRGISWVLRCRTRHNQRPSRKASSLSSGRNRPGLTSNGVVLESAFSLRRRSAWRYIWVVSTDSWPSQRAMMERSIPCCRSFMAAVCRLCLLTHSRHTTAMHLLRSGNEVNMVSYWLGHADINTTHVYLEIDMEMKRQMLQKAPAPAIDGANPWRKPGILEWLTNLAKAPQLCGVCHQTNAQSDRRAESNLNCT